jgi:HK97 family phage portal protein
MPWQWPFRRRTEDRALWNVGDLPVPSTYAGVGVNADSAMRLSAVWGCVRLLADCVSTLPLDVYRKGERTPLATLPPLLVQPAADADLADWLYMVMASLLLRGNAYGTITDRAGAGLLPAQVDLAHPDMVVPPRIEDPPAQRIYRVNGVEYEPAAIWHVRAYRMPGSLVGLSPVTYARQAIGLGLGAERYAAQWFGEGAVPAGVIETTQPLTRGQAMALQEMWMLRHAGLHRPAVLGGGAKYNAISVAPEESQFLESTKANVATICRYYGVPPEMMAAESGNSLTYANVEQRSLDFLVYGVRPWLVRLERAISTLLPRSQHARFNPDAIVRVALKDRYEAHQIGIAAGFLTVNEARELEDLPPLQQGGAVA